MLREEVIAHTIFLYIVQVAIPRLQKSLHSCQPDLSMPAIFSLREIIFILMEVLPCVTDAEYIRWLIQSPPCQLPIQQILLATSFPLCSTYLANRSLVGNSFSFSVELSMIEAHYRCQTDLCRLVSTVVMRLSEIPELCSLMFPMIDQYINITCSNWAQRDSRRLFESTENFTEDGTNIPSMLGNLMFELISPLLPIFSDDDLKYYLPELPNGLVAWICNEARHRGKEIFVKPGSGSSQKRKSRMITQDLAGSPDGEGYFSALGYASTATSAPSGGFSDFFTGLIKGKRRDPTPPAAPIPSQSSGSNITPKKSSSNGSASPPHSRRRASDLGPNDRKDTRYTPALDRIKQLSMDGVSDSGSVEAHTDLNYVEDLDGGDDFPHPMPTREDSEEDRPINHTDSNPTTLGAAHSFDDLNAHSSVSPPTFDHYPNSATSTTAIEDLQPIWSASGSQATIASAAKLSTKQSRLRWLFRAEDDFPHAWVLGSWMYDSVAQAANETTSPILTATTSILNPNPCETAGTAWGMRLTVPTQLKAIDAPIRAMSVDSHESILAVGGKKAILQIFSLREHIPTAIASYGEHRRTITSVEILNDRQRVVSVDKEIGLKVWDVETKRTLATVTHNHSENDLIYAVCTSNHPAPSISSIGEEPHSSYYSDQVFMLVRNNRLVLYDIRTGQMRQDSVVHNVAEWSLGKSFFYLGNMEPLLPTQRMASSTSAYPGISNNGPALAHGITSICSGGMAEPWISIGGSGGQICTMDARMGRIIQSWSAHQDSIIHMFAYRRNGLVTVSLDRTARLWDLNNPKHMMVSSIVGLPDAQSGMTAETVKFVSFSRFRNQPNDVLYAISGHKVVAAPIPKSGRQEVVAQQHYFTDHNGNQLKRSRLAISSAQILPLKRMVLLGCEDGTIKLAV